MGHANRNVVIVGGDAAGMSAASRLARSGNNCRITVFEKTDVVSYAACGMPYHLDKRIPDRAALLVRSKAAFEAMGMSVHTRHEVTGIDADRGMITVRSEGGTRAVPYDALLLATGARAVVPALHGGNAPNVFTFRSFNDLERLSDFIDKASPRRAVIVGGGYIGVELAEVFLCRGLDVRVFEAASHLMSATLDPEISAAVAGELRSQGVHLHLDEGIGGFDVDDSGHVHGIRTDRGRYPTDVVILSIGVKPETELAASAGLDVDARSRAIIVDGSLRTSREGIWAAGDCATSIDIVTGMRSWVPLGPAANKQGRVAAESILGSPVHTVGNAGTALVKACDLDVGRTGLTSAQATAGGFDFERVVVQAPDRAHYYPGSRETTVLLIAEKQTRRLLGGQVIGRSGVAGRTNVLATALHGHMSVTDVAGLDLGYAPPFAPVWDPILIAANQFKIGGPANDAS